MTLPRYKTVNIPVNDIAAVLSPRRYLSRLGFLWFGSIWIKKRVERGEVLQNDDGNHGPSTG